MQAKNCETGYFVTLSITRPHTTYTTVNQLGSPTNCATATTTEQQAIITTTQTPASFNSQTAVSSNDGNTSATTIGIIVGCIILGVLLLLALCCTLRQHGKRSDRPPRLIADLRDRKDRLDHEEHQVSKDNQVHREPKAILDHQGQLDQRACQEQLVQLD